MISKMKKLTAAVLRSDAGPLMRRLMWQGTLAVEQTPLTGGLQPSERSVAEETAAAAASLGEVDEALRLLKPYHPAKGLFARRRAVSEEDLDKPSDSALAAAAEVREAAAELSALEEDEAQIAGEMTALEPWLGCDLPVKTLRTAAAAMLFVLLPVGRDFDSFAEAAENAAVGCVCRRIARPVSNSDDKASAVMPDAAAVVCRLADESAVRSALTRLGGNVAELPYDEAPMGALSLLRERTAAVGEKKQACRDRLTALAAHQEELELCSDSLNALLTTLEGMSKTASTASAVLVTGWVPLGAADAIGATLDKAGACWEMTDPAEGDEPPTLLINRPLAAPFESVIGLYSLPAYGTYDPTGIMAVFYFILFGLMLGDVIYGLMLTVGGILALKLLDLGRGTKNLVKLFAICGVSCAISGLLFGSWMGDLPSVFMSKMLGVEIGSVALWFDMVEDPMSFLIVAMVVGAVHLLTGMAVQGVLLWKDGKRFEAIFDIGSWFVLFGGIGLYFLSPIVGLIVAGIGALMLIATQGRDSKNPIMRFLKGLYSLYNIINYVSDLLSYSRVMALGLATAVIAQVINILATLLGPSVAGWIMMPVILIVGHVVNLAINLLGAFVHTSRLQYIEFFGKFFVDGGRPFRPLSPKLTYTDIR